MQITVHINQEKGGFHTILVLEQGKQLVDRKDIAELDLVLSTAAQLMHQHNVLRVEVMDPGKLVLTTGEKATLTRKQVRLFIPQATATKETR